jgi:hypothetical protein
MRKLISSIVLVGITILMLIPVQPLQPVQQVQALPENEVHYTVRYTCIVSPWPPPGTIMGEWQMHCDGSMTGWGTMPYEHTSCYTTEFTFAFACPGPWKPEEPQ